MSNKFKNTVRWAKITKAGSDDKQFATQQMTYLGKVADGVMVFPYGFHANAAPDSLALMFAIQGNPDNRAAIPWEHKNRPKLASGEVAFYHPSTDAFIIWRKSGDLDIETGGGGTKNVNIKCKDANIACDTTTVTATTSVTVDTPLATFTGNVAVDGSLQVDVDFNNDGDATLGGSGGLAIARVGDAVAGGLITGGSATHTAT